MPLPILPLFSDDMTIINHYMAVQQKGNKVYWFQGNLPVFRHHVSDSNVVERAAQGAIPCPVEFEDQVDLQYAGVLVTLPALIACSILRGISRFDLLKVYYTTTQLFLSLAFMVMLRVKQLEQSKLISCGELGRCLGMDRTPCVQTLRERLRDFTAVADVNEWSLDIVQKDNKRQ